MSEASSERVLLEDVVARQRSEVNVWISTNQVRCLISHDEEDLAIVIATVVTAVESEGATDIHGVHSDGGEYTGILSM